MKYQYIIIGLLLSIIGILFYSRRTSSNSANKSTSLNYETLPYYSPLMQVDDSAERSLECEYQPGRNVNKRLDVIDIINKRMRILQKHRSSYHYIMNQAKENQWHPYQALYNEALRQLIHEGLLVYNKADACGTTEVIVP